MRKVLNLKLQSSGVYFLIATFYLCEPVVLVAHYQWASKEASIVTHFPFPPTARLSSNKAQSGNFPMSPRASKAGKADGALHRSEAASRGHKWEAVVSSDANAMNL